VVVVMTGLSEVGREAVHGAGRRARRLPRAGCPGCPGWALPFAGLTFADGTASAATTGVLYTPNTTANPNEDASYPRVIRLEHSGASNGMVLATFSHSGAGTAKAGFPIYQSTNGGQSWSASPIGTVTDTVHGWDLDGPTLYELPQAEGSLPAGTLLASGTAWNRNDYTQQAIEVFFSTDHGATWSYRSSCTCESCMANTQGHGIWEPQFTVASNGSLVCYFSDERPSTNNYNQVLAHTVSTDGGATWGSEVYDVAVQDGVQRPGMADVVKLQRLLRHDVRGLQERIRPGHRVLGVPQVLPGRPELDPLQPWKPGADRRRQALPPHAATGLDIRRRNQRHFAGLGPAPGLRQ
jgi:hypothetical protein